MRVSMVKARDRPRGLGKAQHSTDKQAFHAIGKGDILIDIPSDDATSKILLKDVLYAPSMGVTLVSISRIAAAGSTVVFSVKVQKSDQTGD